jgi:hypothetical protein
MTEQASQPSNKSFLSPIGFRFVIQRLPHVNYFCNSVTLPDITLGQVDTFTNTFIKIPVPGDKLVFGTLDVRFRVDEDMKNFKEIYDWLIGLGYPDNFGQRANVTRGLASINQVYSDASLVVTTSQFKPNIEIKFTDMYPVSLSALEFNIEGTDVEYLIGNATFAYRKYDLTIL